MLVTRDDCCFRTKAVVCSGPFPPVSSPAALSPFSVTGAINTSWLGWLENINESCETIAKGCNLSIFHLKIQTEKALYPQF